MIPTRTHAIIDYIVGPLLILAPYLFGFADGGAAQWTAMIVGFAIIGMGLFTNYELSLSRLIPMPVHLGMDVAVGLLLAVSPWLFGFADLIWWPHLLVGLAEIVIAAMTSRRPSYADGTIHDNRRV